MTTFPLTEADVQALATAQSFDRGADYYDEGAVDDLVQRGGTIMAAVHGSSYEPYHVRIELTDEGVGATFCTCPYDWGGDCKHIVAVLLTLIRDSDQVEQKRPLSELLETLPAEALRRILLGLTEMDAGLTEIIEEAVDRLETRPSAPRPQTPILVDINAVRREIDKDFRLAGHADPYESGYYDEYAAMAVYADEILAPHLAKVREALDAGEWDTAVALITTIFDAYANGIEGLDEWVYDYNEDTLYDTAFDAGVVLAEVLLSRDLSPDEEEDWLAQIDAWEEAMGDLDVARTAVEHGWSYPPLASAMAGNITEQGAWEGDAPSFADALAEARLRILERQNRRREYINLAFAEGQTASAIVMRVKVGEIETAAEEAKKYLGSPAQVLSVARAMADEDATATALAVAEHGLTLEYEQGAEALGQWVREHAADDRPELALAGARAAFKANKTLANYTAVREPAGEQWAEIKPDLLQQLAEKSRVEDKVDIYLHEGMVREAMTAVDRAGYISDAILHRVAEAAAESHPDWGIGKYRRKAKAIMDAGKSNHYKEAAAYLTRARDIYLKNGRRAEWEQVLDDLLDTHHRKYKLVPMLRDIRT